MGTIGETGRRTRDSARRVVARLWGEASSGGPCTALRNPSEDSRRRSRCRPNYETGQAQTLLAPALAAHRVLRVSTKAGYFTVVTGTVAVDEFLLLKFPTCAWGC